jgi:hypothetical protein
MCFAFVINNFHRKVAKSFLRGHRKILDKKINHKVHKGHKDFTK